MIFIPDYNDEIIDLKIDVTTANKSEDGFKRNLYITVPGIAYSVVFEFSDPGSRDPLQKAVLALLRFTPYTVPLLTHDLGIPKNQDGLVENVLRSLCDEGVINNENGFYKSPQNSDYPEDEFLEKVSGWVFWNTYDAEFCTQIIINSGLNNINKFNELIFKEENQSVVNNNMPDIRDRNEKLMKVLVDDKLLIIEKDQNDFKTCMNKQIINASFQKIYKHLNLYARVQIRPRLNGKAAMFFFYPKPIPSDVITSTYHPEIEVKIEKNQNESMAWLLKKAEEVNNAFLESENAVIIENLGGEAKLGRDAKTAFEQMIVNSCIKEEFMNDDLTKSAEDAERNLILHKSSAISATGVCNAFERILQIFSRILGDRMGKSHIFEKINTEFINLRKKHCDISTQMWKDEVKALINLKSNEAGIELGGFRINSYFADFNNKILSASKQTNNRHQIGSAFILWITPLFSSEKDAEISIYRQWVIDAFKSFPNLAEVINIAMESRNDNKVNYRDNPNVNQVRTNIYRIWKAIGSTAPMSE